jgi:(2Fe-2S) ferredoxin
MLGADTGGEMEPYRLHVFFCKQQKPGGLTCCAARGAAESLAALQAAIAAEGLADEVMVTTCDSFGMCGRGPNLIVYPEGLWYHGVTPEAAAEIVREHFRHGRPVERLLERDMEKLRAEFLVHRARMRETQARLAQEQAQQQ